MTFATDEAGVQSSRPRDLYELALPAVTYRLTSAVRDVTYNGQTYRAGVIGRATQRVPTPTGGESALEISMAVSHAVVQRYLRAGIPPRQIAVTARRLQSTSGDVEFLWQGNVKSLTVEGNSATLIVPSRMAEAMLRRIPTLSVGMDCPHTLYDARCQVNRNAFKVSTTVTAIALDGRTITVASIGANHNDGWAQFGEFLHLASGERFSVLEQIGTELKIHLPIVDMQIGDSVEIYAGCGRDINTCDAKFDNVINFGGMPQLPTKNPFLPNGFGIYESE